MDRQKILGVLIIVFMITLAFVVGDFVKNKKWQRFNNPSNWHWADRWSQPGNPSVPVLPPVIPAPEQPPPQSGVLIAQTYQAALDISAKTGKPIFVFFENSSCDWCKKMRREVLPNAAVQNLLKNYVQVYINTDTDKSVAQRFGIRYLPGYVITNSQQQSLKSGSKFVEVREFTQWLNNPGLY